jgi:hypothetical protein
MLLPKMTGLGLAESVTPGAYRRLGYSRESEVRRVGFDPTWVGSSGEKAVLAASDDNRGSKSRT